MHPTPTAEHTRLAALTGSWDVQIQFWSRPGAPPTKSRGFSVIEPLFGGLFLQERVEGLIGESPFVSLTWYGFNPTTRQYETSRIASTRADRVDESGTFDPEKGALVLEAASATPGGRVRTVLHTVGPDELLLERFVLPPSGAPWRSAEIRYTRRP